MSNRYRVWGLAGTLASRTADEMSGTALMLFAVAGSAGVEGAAVVFGSLTVSAAVGGPPLGVWLDRATSGRALAAALAFYAVGLAGCAAALDSGSTTLAAGLALVAGLAGPAVSGGWSGALAPGEGEVSRRMAAFDAGTFNVSGLLGPALAGVGYAVVHPAAPLALTLGLLALGSACAACMGRVPRSGRPGHPVRDLVEGTRAIASDAGLRTATLASCLTHCGIGAFLVAVPVLGEQHFGSAGLGTVLLLTMAAAALASNAWADRRDALRRPVTVLTAATLLGALGLVTAAVPAPWAVVTGAVLLGLGDGPQLASLIQLRHDLAPRRLITQVFTTGASLKITAAGAGAYLAGVIGPADPAVVLLCAAAMHLAAVAVLVPSARRERGTLLTVGAASQRPGAG